MTTERDTYHTDPNVIPDTTPLPRPVLSGVTEPKPTDVVLVSYPDTIDGTAAAWVFYQIAKRDNIPVEFVKELLATPFEPTAKEVLDRNWIAICDGPAPSTTYGKSLLGFEGIQHKSFDTYHYKTEALPYMRWKRTMPFGIETMATLGKVGAIVDPKKSLCRLVWEFFCSDRVGFNKPPRLITHIDDVVTGTLRYNDSKDIVTAVSTYPREFKTYSALAKACDDRRRREAMIAAGQGIARYLAQSQKTT